MLVLAMVTVQPSNAWVSGKSADVSMVPSGSAALTSASAAVNLVAVLPPTLGVSISTLNLQIAILDTGQRSAVVAVPVTSSWTLSSSANAVELVGYFESPQRALTDATGNAVPSRRVLGAINAESMRPFVDTASIGTPGASRILFRQAVSRLNLTGSRTDTLKVQVDSVADLGIPKGQYTGTLHLRVISY